MADNGSHTMCDQMELVMDKSQAPHDHSSTLIANSSRAVLVRPQHATASGQLAAQVGACASSVGASAVSQVPDSQEVGDLDEANEDVMDVDDSEVDADAEDEVRTRAPSSIHSADDVRRALSDDDVAEDVKTKIDKIKQIMDGPTQSSSSTSRKPSPQCEDRDTIPERYRSRFPQLGRP